MLIGLLVMMLTSTANDVPEDAGWPGRLAASRADSAQLQEDLKTWQKALQPRVATEAPKRLDDIVLEAPPPPSGWGLLPEITAAEPPRPVPLSRQSYSLESLSRRIFEARERLASRRVETRATGLAAEIDAFRHAADDHLNIEAHLAYHEEWQPAVARHVFYFQHRNRLMARVEQLAAFEASEQGDKAAALRSGLLDDLGVFRATPALHIERRSEKAVQLVLPVCTDIMDTSFLRQVENSVAREFQGTVPSTGDDLSVRVDWRLVDAATLYADAPTRGEPINIVRHRARFRDCPLVMTTGASATHARVGESVFLGTAPISERVLAHEFGHLLGFEDAYLRGFEGQTTDPWGVTLVEWWGLSDDLMGNAGAGVVSDRMLETLVQAYGNEDVASP